MEIIKSTEYVPPPESNMNGHHHHSHILSHQNQSCGRAQRGGEWESTVNGRAKSRSAAPVPAPTQAAVDARRKKTTTKPQMDGHDRLMNSRSLRTTSKGKNQRPAGITQRTGEKVKGVVGYQSATACYVGGGGMHPDSAVFGVYSETKYTFAVNGMPGTSAQASAAAAFFARWVSHLLTFVLA
ncbi:hypothetical protein BDFB_010721 [Asbolus verrucosus]|uniref:Uncharacterized protein n=1 Tax=Asbolus verrucosus TaxID=1661398 RepID=A0A482VHA4_ASBVE|nr:hypothetical protein BDFB_010721 [Asbolus verrucosus]